MWLGAFVIGPAAMALLAWLAPRRGAAAVLALTAAAHLAGSLALWLAPGWARGGGVLVADALGTVMLLVSSALFLACALYSLPTLGRPAPADPAAARAGRRFAPALLMFLAAMDLVLLTRHFVLMWIGVEATTLATAPLILHERTPGALAATWRYLLLCSVGIALALLGTFALGLACGPGETGFRSLQLASLLARGATLDPTWLRIAFILLLVGYGTKMGLAPFHTWLPDAHGEAPAPVSALLSGALLNCAFVALLRGYQVCAGAGQGAFAAHLLLGVGLLSMAVAAVFIVGQQDYKRMLAFSSVEHMGVLAVGVGLGGAGLYGSMLHALNHSLAKALLFLTAGNILGAYGSKRAARVRGLLHALPFEGALFVCGYFAVSGFPPFGLFFSELMILSAGLHSAHPGLGLGFLALLVVVAVGMAAVTLPMIHGRAQGPVAAVPGGWTRGAPALLLTAAVAGGLALPPALVHLLRAAAQSLAR
jgi:hydrogenase-4 component F